MEERYRRIVEERDEPAARWWYRCEALLLLLRPSLWTRPQVRGDPAGRGALLEDLRFALRLASRTPVATGAMVAAGVFIRNLERARAVDLGFDPNGVGMVSVDIDFVGYDREQ